MVEVFGIEVVKEVTERWDGMRLVGSLVPCPGREVGGKAKGPSFRAFEVRNARIRAGKKKGVSESEDRTDDRGVEADKGWT